MAHALLSPSAASRWLTCTPSVRLEEAFPDRTSEAAEEGTLAHSLGELIILNTLGLMTKKAYASKLKEIKADKFYNETMQQHCEDYAAFVVERYNEALSRNSDAQIVLEKQIDLTKYLPEGFGTGDVVIVSDDLLEIIDLKYGKGVPVSSEKNKQLMLYGLGVLESYDFLYDIKEVRLTIFQPRIDNTSSWSIDAAELRTWGEEFVIPTAKAAFEGTGEFVVGDHCRFCKAKAQCRALADYNLELAKYDFKAGNLLSDEEVSDILKRADFFTKWISAVEDFALLEAVNNDKHWPGFKLVEGRSNRQYSDESKVAGVYSGQGLSEEDYYNRKLKGITDMEKKLGKKTFDELVGPLLIKPAGKPTLVPETDKRPEYHSAKGAASDFAEYIEIDN
jgi:hypothetical protein